VDALPPFSRGARALRRLLGQQTFDLRGLDLAGFRCWLGCHLTHWQDDPIFAQRVHIRDLRRGNPRLRALEQQYRRAVAADARSPQFARLRQVEQELHHTARAIAGLTEALHQAAQEKQPALVQKLAAFEAREQALRQEQAALVAASPQRQLLQRIDPELKQLRSAIGVDREQDVLNTLLRQQGRRSGERGEAFEQLALALTRDRIVPDLLRRRKSGHGAEDLHVLSGVTLGAARTEFDHLVIRPPRRAGEPVEVLAVVEAKRNANDLAHGFRLRQENLAWLTGDSANYDPGTYRTGHFRSGHFERDAEHVQEGETFVFARCSFRRFRRDRGTGSFVDRLYFITRARPLWGVSTAALGRISFRVATDERWQPDKPAYLRRLQRWCESLAEPIETPDVLRLYLATPRGRRQVLVAGP
jgi:hypothetical protein